MFLSTRMINTIYTFHQLQFLLKSIVLQLILKQCSYIQCRPTCLTLTPLRGHRILSWATLQKKDAGIPVYVSELGVLVYIFSKERIKRAECLWLVYQFP